MENYNPKVFINIFKKVYSSIFYLFSSSINLLFSKHQLTLEAFGYDYIQFGKTGFQEISACKKLKEIHIGEDNTQGIEFLEYLNKLNTLESLQIHKCLKISDTILFQLFSTPNFFGNLKRFHLKEIHLKDKTLILIANG